MDNQGVPGKVSPIWVVPGLSQPANPLSTIVDAPHVVAADGARALIPRSAGGGDGRANRGAATGRRGTEQQLLVTTIGARAAIKVGPHARYAISIGLESRISQGVCKDPKDAATIVAHMCQPSKFIRCITCCSIIVVVKGLAHNRPEINRV